MSGSSPDRALSEVAGRLESAAGQVDRGLFRRSPVSRHAGQGAALRELAKEVGNPARLGGVDLLAAFPPEVLVPPMGRATEIVRRLEIVRDIMIFMPILLAWWQLHNALNAYGATDGKEAFLYAWQHGLPGGISTWTLSSTARVVAALLFSIIGLTLFLHFLDRRAFREPLRAQVASDLALATLLIGRRGSGAAALTERSLNAFGTSFQESVESMTSELRTAGGQIGEALKGETAQRLAGAVAELATSVGATAQAAEDLRRLGESLHAPQQVLERLEELHRGVVAEGARMQAGLNGLVVQLGTAAQSAERSANEHQVMARAVADMTRTLHDWTAGSMENLGVLVHQMRNALEQVDGAGYRRGPV